MDLIPAGRPCPGADHRNYDAFVLRLNLCSNPNNCPPIRLSSGSAYQLSYSVFPNPFENQTEVSIESYSDQAAMLFVHDFVGKTVIQKPISLSDGLTDITLDLSPFNSGIYIFEIRTSDEVHYATLIKQR
jgi:hypothetical protein